MNQCAICGDNGEQPHMCGGSKGLSNLPSNSFPCLECAKLRAEVQHNYEMAMQEKKDREAALLRVKQLDEDLAQALDDHNKCVEAMNLQKGEWVDFAGALVQKIHDLQHTGSSPLCQQPTCKAFYEKRPAQTPKCEHPPYAQIDKGNGYCAVCERPMEKRNDEQQKKDNRCSTCGGSGLMPGWDSHLDRRCKSPGVCDLCKGTLERGGFPCPMCTGPSKCRSSFGTLGNGIPCDLPEGHAMPHKAESPSNDPDVEWNS